MRIQALAIALFVGAVVPGYAADAVVEDVVVVDSAYNWSGAYIGAQIGYGWGKSEMSIPGIGVASYPDPDGLLGGVYGGFNYQFSSNVLLGIEGDFAFAKVRGDDIAYENGIPAPDAVIDSDMNWTGAIRGRVGYALDRFLPYLSAGVAFADYDHSGTSGGAIAGSFSQTYTGWTLGAGVDFALTDHVILRGEYRYTDFGSEDFPVLPSFNAHDLDLSTNDIRFGIAYKF